MIQMTKMILPPSETLMKEFAITAKQQFSMEKWYNTAKVSKFGLTTQNMKELGLTAYKMVMDSRSAWLQNLFT